jgi:hypothetical protein
MCLAEAHLRPEASPHLYCTGRTEERKDFWAEMRGFLRSARHAHRAVPSREAGDSVVSAPRRAFVGGRGAALFEHALDRVDDRDRAPVELDVHAIANELLSEVGETQRFRDQV